MSAPYQYVVVRKANAAGITACQAIHAATESMRTAPAPPDTHVVLLEAKDGDELVALSEKLTAAGVHHVLIREPDPPYNGAATAVGVEPQDRDAIRPFMAGFKVLR